MPNPVCEFQIISKDPDRTGQFYSDLFGWAIKTDNLMGYRRIDTSSKKGIQGGIWPAPPQASNFVQLLVSVADVAATVLRAQAIGARVLIPTTDLPEGGEIAVLQDNQGMPFAVCRRI